jgi:hypothetical protein
MTLKMNISFTASVSLPLACFVFDGTSFFFTSVSVPLGCFVMGGTSFFFTSFSVGLGFGLGFFFGCGLS